MNRFKQLREEENERRKDINPKNSLTADELSAELFEKCNFQISPGQIRKLESDTPGVKINPELLLAYKNFFNVCVDWLVDERVSARSFEGNIAVAAKTTGLSEKSIHSLKKLNQEYTTTRPVQTLNTLLEDTFNAGALLNNISLFIGNSEEWTQSICNLESFDEETQGIHYRDISESECFAIHSLNGILALNKDDLIDALSLRQIQRTLNEYKEANTPKKRK
jgi:hypothetical protein